MVNSGAEVGRGRREWQQQPPTEKQVEPQVPRKPQPSLTPNPCKCLKEKKENQTGGKGAKTDRLGLALGRGKTPWGFV